MGFIGDIVSHGIDVVKKTVGLAIDLVRGVVTAVTTMLANKWVLIIGAVVLGIYLMYPAVIAASQATVTTMATLYPVEVTVTAGTWAKISTFMTTLSANFKLLLEAIHFKTALAVHEVAYLVSADYRVMMAGVYEQLGEASQALGFYPQFLALAIRNSRTLVLDASTSLGMNYDLGQVQWLSTFNEYLKKFNTKAEAYHRNPAALFEDLDNWIDRPVMDTKGGFVKGLIVSVNGVVKTTETVVKDIVVVRNDIDRLVRDLPENIRSQILPHVTPIIKRFDTFLDETYAPSIKTLKGITSAIEEKIGKAKEDMGNLIDRLKRPGTYLTEIDDLSPEERAAQEEIIAEISQRTYRRDVEAFERTVTPEYQGLLRIREAVELITLTPLEFPSEYPAPRRAAGVKAKPRETWFVGDY